MSRAPHARTHARTRRGRPHSPHLQEPPLQRRALALQRLVLLLRGLHLRGHTPALAQVPPPPPPTSPAALGGCPVLGTPPNMGGAGWPEAGGRCWEQQGPAQVSTHLRHRPSLVPSPSEEAGGVPPGQRRPSCHWFCDTRGTETGCPAANRPVRARRVEPVTLPAPAPRSPPRPGPFGCTVAHRRSAQQAAVAPRA